MVKKFEQFVNEDVYFGDYYDRKPQRNETPINDSDDAYETFTQHVLPKYSTKEISIEASPGLRNYVCELFDDGNIKTVQDMIDTVQDLVDRGIVDKYIDY